MAVLQGSRRNLGQFFALKQSEYPFSSYELHLLRLHNAGVQPRDEPLAGTACSG